jgi:hypothetical protein
MNFIPITVEVVIPTETDLIVKLEDGEYAVAYLSEKHGWRPSLGVEAGDGRTFLTSNVVAWCFLNK